MGEWLNIKKNPHILLVSRSLPFHALGGMEVVAWDLARQFVRDGLTVTCLTTEVPGKPQTFTAEGVNVVALHGTKSGRYSRAWWKKSREYFEKNLSESITGVLSVSAAAYGLVHAKKYSIPFILQAHGTSIGEIKSKWRTFSPKAIVASLWNVYGLIRDLYFYPRFDQVVAIGQPVLNDLQRLPLSLVLPKNKMQIINNGIDDKLFFPDKNQRQVLRQSLGLTDQTKIILSASRLHRQKGVGHGLRAFSEYLKLNPDAFYLILGDGPERASLEQLTKALKIDKKVLFKGAVKREQLNSYLTAADVFLFTTVRNEGLPLNILEALAAGLPVILSKQLAEAISIKEGVHGIDPENEMAIVDLISQVTTKRETIHSLLPDFFTLQHCAKQYHHFFIH